MYSLVEQFPQGQQLIALLVPIGVGGPAAWEQLPEGGGSSRRSSCHTDCGVTGSPAAAISADRLTWRSRTADRYIDAAV